MNPIPSSTHSPTYREVTTGETGFVEVLNVELDSPHATPEIYEKLIRFFFQFHDPTTLNRQGNDRGTQYASFVFTTDDEQTKIAEKVKKELQGYIDDGKLSRFFDERKVETVITAYTAFHEAHEEHQRYLEKNPYGYW